MLSDSLLPDGLLPKDTARQYVACMMQVSVESFVGNLWDTTRSSPIGSAQSRINRQQAFYLKIILQAFSLLIYPSFLPYSKLRIFY